MANSTGLVSFPPDVQCFIDAGHWASPACHQPTQAMVNFLNLTQSIDTYIDAYCNKPPNDDSCPFGYCPDPEVAGPLVRIAAYLSNMSLCILIVYSSEEITASFWSQLLTVYSLVITCVISVLQRSLSRLHAIIAVAIVGSPLTFFIAVYALRATWGSRNRLDVVVGPGRGLQRGLALSAVGILIMFAFYILLPHHMSHFAQPNCDSTSVVVIEFFILPFIAFKTAAKMNWFLAVVLMLPVLLVGSAWVAVLYLRHKFIWPEGRRSKWFRFWTVWHMVGQEFPFVHFATTVMLPFAYWVLTVEYGAYGSNDNYFSLSFGQVLALFVAVPPLYDVSKLIPRLGSWFWDLSWMRYVTRRPQSPPPRLPSYSSHYSVFEPASPAPRYYGCAQSPLADDGSTAISLQTKLVGDAEAEAAAADAESTVQGRGKGGWKGERRDSGDSQADLVGNGAYGTLPYSHEEEDWAGPESPTRTPSPDLEVGGERGAYAPAGGESRVGAAAAFSRAVT